MVKRLFKGLVTGLIVIALVLVVPALNALDPTVKKANGHCVDVSVLRVCAGDSGHNGF